MKLEVGGVAARPNGNASLRYLTMKASNLHTDTPGINACRKQSTPGLCALPAAGEPPPARAGVAAPSRTRPYPSGPYRHGKHSCSSHTHWLLRALGCRCLGAV